MSKRPIGQPLTLGAFALAKPQSVIRAATADKAGPRRLDHMTGWLLRVSERETVSSYAVWIASQEEALRRTAQTLGVLPEEVEVAEKLSDATLDRLGAQPGRIARVMSCRWVHLI